MGGTRVVFQTTRAAPPKAARRVFGGCVSIDCVLSKYRRVQLCSLDGYIYEVHHSLDGYNYEVHHSLDGYNYGVKIFSRTPSVLSII